MIELKPCPFCGSQNLTKYRFDIGGFLNKEGCTETVCENGDTFRIECDCGCKFDKNQDYLFDKFQDIFGCDGGCFTSDLWAMMVFEWNKRNKRVRE